MMGEVQEILVTELAHDRTSLVGHNKYYHQVLVSEECQKNYDHSLMGRLLRVQITEATKHSLKCRVIRDISPKEWDESTYSSNTPHKISEKEGDFGEEVEKQMESEAEACCGKGSCGPCGDNPQEAEVPIKLNKKDEKMLLEKTGEEYSRPNYWVTACVSITVVLIAGIYYKKRTI